MSESLQEEPHEASRVQRWLLPAVEVVSIFLLFFIYAAIPTPGDDEAHYLGKAKHYFDPTWLPDDFFVGTGDAHHVFNWTLGWLTLWLPLPAVAWIGRVVVWGLLAWAWRRLSYAVVPRHFVGLLSAALFLLFQEYGNLAREWIVRGVEAKCFAYVLVLLGLEAVVRGRWHRVWLLLGAASAFHVLVGGWSVVAAGMTYLATKDRPPLLKVLPWVVAGGVFSLPGLLPGLWLTRGVEPEVVAAANQIYLDRLSHHLIAHTFEAHRIFRFGAMIAAWVGLCVWIRHNTRGGGLIRFVAASLVIAGIGVVIDQATLESPERAAAILRYYWYRLADVMAPIGLALAIVEAVHLVGPVRRTGPAAGTEPATPANPEADQNPPQVPSGRRDLLWLCVALAPMFVLSWRSLHDRGDPRSGAERQSKLPLRKYEDWLTVNEWIRHNTPTDATFLTPLDLWTLRWRGQRGEVVSWKDIPQEAGGIVQWDQRLDKTERFWGNLQRDGMNWRAGERLAEMIDLYGVDYVIVDQRRYRRFTDNDQDDVVLVRVFPAAWQEEPTYAVYRVKPSSKDGSPTR